MTDETDEQWTDWTRLDEAAPLLAIGTEQTYDELAGTLVHLQDLGLMQLGRDRAGAIYFRARWDDEARVAAWLDDEAQRRKN